MVDEVRIVDSDLPAWATEQTLTNLVSAIKDLKNLTASQGESVKNSLTKMATTKDGNPKDALSEIERIFANNKSGIDESVGNVYSNMGDAANSLEQTSIKSKIYNTIMDNGEAVMFKFGKAIGLSTKSLGSLETAIWALGVKLFNLTVGGITASLSMYMELYKSGMLYNNMVGSTTHGLGVLGQAAINAGMPVTMMGELLKKFNTSIQRFGIEGFGMIAKNTQALGATLGLSASESAESLAQYMDNARKAGTLSTMTMEQVQKNAVVQMRATMDFAREMNTTTDVLKESQAKIMDSAEFKSGMATIPAEIRAKMGDVASQMLGMFDAKGMGEVGQELMQVMAKGPLAMGDKFMTDLMSLGPSGNMVANQILQLGQSFKDGNITQEEMVARSKDLMKSLGEMSKDTSVGDIVGKFAMFGEDLSKYNSLAAAGLEASADIQKEKQEHDDKIAKSMSNQKTALERITNIFGDIGAQFFANDDFVEKFGTVLDIVSNGMMKLADIIVEHMPEIVKFVGDVVVGLVSFAENLAAGKSVFNDVKSWMQTLGIVFGVFGVLFDGVGKIVTIFNLAASGIGYLMTALELAFLPVAAIVIAVGGALYGLYDGFANYKPENLWAGFKNIFISLVKGITDPFIWIGGMIYKAGAFLLDKLGLSGASQAANEQVEKMTQSKNEIWDNVRESNGIHKIVNDGSEVEKPKEQVITTTATQEAKAEEKAKEKEQAKAAVKSDVKSKGATENDVYQSSETSNKINKSILDAAKYTNTLLEALNNHAASIEKNTKAVSSGGSWG